MENTTEPEPVHMGNLTAVLHLLGTEICQQVEQKSQVSQDQVKSGFIETLEELRALKAEVKNTKAILEGFTTFQAKTAPKDTEAEFVQIIQSTDHSSVIEELEAKKQELLNRCAILDSKHQSLMIQNQALKREHQSELENVSSKLEDSDKRAKALRIQVGRLQTYLTKNATNANELIDSEITAKLEMIQARTQTLVEKFCVGDCEAPNRDPGEFVTFDDDWTKKLDSLKNKSRLSHEDQDVFKRFWVRSKLYMLLEKRIFSQQVFGLEPDLEESLAEFEHLVIKHNRDADISDWRALTLRYSTGLGMKNNALAMKTAKYIQAMFLPWVLGNPANIDKKKSSKEKTYFAYPEELKSDLTELCQAAYDLTVMLRRSTDKYTFVPIQEGTEVLSQESDMFQVQDMIGPKSRLIGSRVWVNLFGALIKETRTDEKHVMMKALVIAKVRPPALQQERSASPRKNRS